MRICYWGKDGGAESTVSGFWLVEIKKLFSVVLLRFDDYTREAYHEHAFNAVSWVLAGGGLLERFLRGYRTARLHLPSWRPVITRRRDFHQVQSFGRTWVLSFRGPWSDRWREYADGVFSTLTHGRRKV